MLSPNKITKATRADNDIEQREDQIVKLRSEYGQDFSNKIKVAVLCAMLPNALQERFLEKCAVS